MELKIKWLDMPKKSWTTLTSIRKHSRRLPNQLIFSIHHQDYVVMPSEQREQHYDTSHRCCIKGIFEFFEKKGIQLTSEQTNDVFKILNLFRSSEYNILRDSDYTRHNDFVKSIETREQSLKIIKAQVTETNKILKEAQDAEDEVIT